jgi:hypothetical protein
LFIRRTGARQECGTAPILNARFSVPLRYRRKEVRLPLAATMAARSQFLLPDGSYLAPGTKLYLPDGKELPERTKIAVQVGEEKGIDIRLALDVIRLTREAAFDVAVIFSKDQDLAEAAVEVFTIARQQSRHVEIQSAYPEGSHNRIGIRNTRRIVIDGATYAACLDPRNYHSTTARRRHRR